MYKVDYPVAFHTVDMSIVKRDEVLLVQKTHEVASGLWRFPGGFVDPSDDCAEDAALREGREETGMEFQNFLRHPEPKKALYIGSAKIDDPRYRESPHKIITSFYMLKWSKGLAGEGKDDVAKTKWFGIVDLLNADISDLSNIVNPIHMGLTQMFLTFVKTQNL